MISILLRLVSFCITYAYKFLFVFIILLLSACSFSGKISPITTSASTGSIVKDGLSVVDSIVVEHGIAILTVSLGKAVNSNVSFTYYTQDQTALSGTDYIGVSGSATIPAGQTEAIVPVSIISNVTKSENKKLFFNISSPVNSDIVSSSSIVQIQDNDYSLHFGFAEVSTRSNHSCGRTTAGGVKCWGNNSNGQLGDGTTTQRITAVDVSGLTSGVASISLGDDHSCALTTTGGLKCWGSNSNGQLGDGTTTQRLTPVDVSGLTSGVAAISLGEDHSCALTTTGGAKCWGNNSNGQLGDGTTTQRLTAVDVSGLTSGVNSISSGWNHNCVVTSTAGARCWGANSAGQLGDSSTTDRLTSVNVTGLTSGVSKVFAGSYHTCALTTAGAMRCWGSNTYGQIGDGTTSMRTTSVVVTGLASGVSDVAAGNTQSCAVTSSGGAKCWGENFYGEIGDGTYTQRTTQVDVSGLTSGVSSISLGVSHSCALTTSGNIKCWGRNHNGQIGNGFSSFKTTSVDVTGLTSGISNISAGGAHSCALTSAGGVKCWGYNNFGQLGDGTTTPQRTSPVDVTGLTSGVSTISTGTNHSCALTSTGGVKCWGQNSGRQLGDGTSTHRPIPVDVTSLTSGVAKISAGSSHTCAVTTTGGAKCWGSNSNNQLGDGTTTIRPTPVDVTGLTSGIAEISAAWSHSCALTTTGGVKCWGFNSNGQLGDGTTTQRSTQVNVTGLTSGVTSISTASSSTCALTTAGGVKCWGGNFFGQLGDGTTTQRISPVDVLGISNGIKSVSTTANATCILTTAGAIKCLGYNGAGELANNSIVDSLSFVDATALSLGIEKLSGFPNGDHFCIITTFGGAKCWGGNSNGKLGNESDTATPQTVVAP